MVLRYSYIPPEGIKALDDYKYSGGAYSWLDNKLNPFWYWCADQFPKSVAPNLITLIGTAFLMSIAVGLWIFDPMLEAAAPAPVYMWFAVSVWVYQTMDAVDGKQARRTGSSSPLGQLFDHGCDALGTMPLALAICSCMGFGRSIWSVILAATIQVPFYMAQYEEHFVHTLRTQVANFGVTEGQYLEAGLMFMTAVVGPAFWDNEVPYTEFLGKGMLPGPNGQENIERLTFRTVSLYAGCLFPFLLGATSAVMVFVKGHYLACLRLIPIITLEALLAWVSMESPRESGLALAFQSYPVPFFMVFGVALTHLANRIIIATVCRIPYPPVEWSVLSPIPFLVLTDPAFKNNRSAQLYILAGYGILVVFIYLHFTLNVGQQIARHLKINILTLGKRKE